MPRVSTHEILVELGAEPLDGSGFQSEEPETEDENTRTDSEVVE